MFTVVSAIQPSYSQYMLNFNSVSGRFKQIFEVIFWEVADSSFVHIYILSNGTQQISAFRPLGTTGTLIFCRLSPADIPQSEDNRFITSQNLVGKHGLEDFYLHN